MNINDLMSRIWSTNATVDGMRTDVQLNSDEWQLILKEWPELYGNDGIIHKTKEIVDKLRDDWQREKCFYLYGHKMRVSIE